MVSALIKSIKDKKEFSTLPDAFIQEKVDAYFKDRKKLLHIIELGKYNEKSKEYKQAVKEIRAGLREIYGVFQKTSHAKRQQLLRQYRDAKGRGEKLKALDKLLLSHQSTKERRDHYQEIYTALFVHDKPEHILDLGCGFNPLAYQWIPGEPAYTCCDLSEDDMGLVQEFFNYTGIDGDAYACDLLKPEAIKLLKATKADTALLLKLVDTLETEERNSSKRIIKALLQNEHVKRIIISFPQKSIGGRTFRTGNKENWFTRFLQEERIGWGVREVGDEQFYDIKR